MSKHSSGPWSVPHFADGKSVCSCAYAFNGGGQVVAQVQWGGSDELSKDEAVANARLIAAAPELLEALIAMEREKSEYMIRNNLGDPALERTNKLARAAIAKATA